MRFSEINTGVIIDSAADFRLGHSLGNFNAEQTEEIVEMAGKSVRKVNLFFEGDSAPKTIYVSDEFGVVDPNWATIYGAIQGMLMEYEIEHYDILMHLKAADIRLKAIEDEEFMVDEDCKFLTQLEFDAFVRDNLKILIRRSLILHASIGRLVVSLDQGDSNCNPYLGFHTKTFQMV